MLKGNMKRLKCLLIAIVFMFSQFAMFAIPAENTVYAADYTGLADTPPMGWNSWNCFAADISAEKIKGIIDQIIDLGLDEAGYEYVNIDDGWSTTTRVEEADYYLQVNSERFPYLTATEIVEDWSQDLYNAYGSNYNNIELVTYDSDGDGEDDSNAYKYVGAGNGTLTSSIQVLADYAHSRGLKLGVYSSAGSATCQRTGAGGAGYEEKDAELYVAWGIDYLKYDWCNHPSYYLAPDIDMISVTDSVYNSVDDDVYGVQIEAESSDNTLYGTASLADISYDDGTTVEDGKVTNIGNNEGYLQFNKVTVDTAGEYRLKIYYSNPDYPYRKAYIQVNGDDPFVLEMPYTGSSSGGMGSSATDVIGTYSDEDDDSLRIDLNAGENTIKIYNEMNEQDNAIELYSAMRNALDEAYENSSNTGKHQVVFSICEWGNNDPWEWGADVGGQLWRTTSDISDTWSSIMSLYDQNILLGDYAGPGHWDDPDMLEVGNGGMTDTEYKTHFSLWSIMAAPLIMGNDLREVEVGDSAHEILSNADVIAIDQDSLGVQGEKIRDDGDTEVIAKPLANGDVAVVLLNRGDSAATISTTASEIGASSAASYVVKDLWSGSKKIVGSVISASVPSHDVAMFRVTAGTDSTAAPAVDLSAVSDEFMEAGSAYTVEVTATNNGIETVSGVEVSASVPAGWTITGSPASIASLAVGASETATFTVTPATGAAIGSYSMTAEAAFSYGTGSTGTSSLSIPVTVPPAVPTATSYLSDLTMAGSSGVVAEDQSVSAGFGGTNYGTITINGTEYEKGIGMSGSASATYYLGGAASDFQAVVGVESSGGFGGSTSADFKVVADGEEIYSNSLNSGGYDMIDLDVTGVKVLRISTTQTSTGFSSAVCDWADAKVIVGGAVTDKNIVSVASPDGIKVYRGTDFDDLDLPEELRVTFDDGSTATLDVQWSSGNYDGDTLGTYTLYGTLVLEDGMTNTGNIKAQITVTVRKRSSSGGGGSSSSSDEEDEEDEEDSGDIITPTTPTTPTTPAKKFTDTAGYSWAEEAIEALAAKGIINGTSETTFEPGRDINRADFMLLLVRALKLEADIDSNFSDVSRDAYYYEALGIAKSLGIATGVGNGSFNPKGEISRQDLMVLVFRALKAAGKIEESGTASDLSGFADASQVTDYAVSSVAALVKLGIIKGDGSNINPHGTATRAEAAVIIYRILTMYNQGV